jgi:hypothetical protein
MSAKYSIPRLVKIRLVMHLYMLRNTDLGEFRCGRFAAWKGTLIRNRVTMRGNDVVLQFAFQALDVAMIEAASKIGVVFPLVLVQFVFTRIASNATIASIN